jgi:hypothetical protein
MTHLYPLSNPPPPTLQSIHPIFLLKRQKRLLNQNEYFFPDTLCVTSPHPPTPKKKRKKIFWSIDPTTRLHSPLLCVYKPEKKRKKTFIALYIFIYSRGEPTYNSSGGTFWVGVLILLKGVSGRMMVGTGHLALMLFV